MACNRKLVSFVGHTRKRVRIKFYRAYPTKRGGKR